ncbi:bifunctional diguanylate cyclase/phosphodiesterase [Clostridium cylindrosporum]|uniref:Diguanylate cyclase/phosphodiesterase n=1 Tax=Clostridium cylindrosporum DSM 605 TaxID=1121307 RepID=A0A0J8DC70_CLOCY|nr:EAL domain-containing protein [Clostridium cylindrosporum]KMT21904.1 diguanylate cyclase/phosphodiesterase [Clostridium cylindrosporum DSM 605]
MIKKIKNLNNPMKIFIQVIILSIIGVILVLNYYKSNEAKHAINMEESIQQVFEKSKGDLYNNYGILKAIVYDLETTPNFHQNNIYPIVKGYLSSNPQISKISFADKDGRILSSLNNSGSDLTYKYKGKSIEASSLKMNSSVKTSKIDIEMKPSIYSDQEIDILYPMYKNRKLIGFLSITIDAHGMFSGVKFKSTLNKNEMLVSTPNGKTIFKSKGFNGENTYIKNVNIEGVTWIVQIESKEDVMGVVMKKAILLALALTCLLSFVIYLEWQLLNKGEYITELTRLQGEIEIIAYSDSLTGLCNRLSITNQISNYIKNAKKEDRCAVIFLDLDDFKNVNDVFGHEKGDKLLKFVAKIFKEISYMDNRIVTSRIGGDEFITLFKDIVLEDEVHSFCKDILNRLSNMSSTNNKKINISASIGVSFFPESGLDVDTLFKNADMAMYNSKAKGKSQYSFFGDEMGEEMQRRALVESRLRTLITRNDFSFFSLVYQPQVPISSESEFKGAEALIRWNDKELGLVFPLEFIEVAENSGTIDALGNWVLRETCHYLKRLESELGIKQNISVNISPKQFRQVNFVEKIIHIVEQEGISPSQITLEITEQVFIDNMVDCVRILNELKAKGFKISLDDFGTGYSSLSYLSQLPIDTLKIDKSFVDNIGSDIHSLSLIEGVLKLSHSINLKVIVEGVETFEQYKLLKELGVDTIQGYYFSKPLTEEDYILFSKSESSKEISRCIP